MLNYIKVTKEQDQMRNIFEKGTYTFTVKSIEEKLRKNKINKMLVIELIVSNHEKKQLTVKDWIMLDMEGMEWKLRHFCASIGIIENYENNTLSINEMLNKQGILKIFIAEVTKENGEIVKVNRVSDYIEKGKINIPEIKEQSFFNDEIKF